MAVDGVSGFLKSRNISYDEFLRIRRRFINLSENEHGSEFISQIINKRGMCDLNRNVYSSIFL